MSWPRSSRRILQPTTRNFLSTEHVDFTVADLSSVYSGTCGHICSLVDSCSESSEHVDFTVADLSSVYSGTCGHLCSSPLRCFIRSCLVEEILALVRGFRVGMLLAMTKHCALYSAACL